MDRQIALRIPEDLLAKLDELVQSGAYESRAAVVRAPSRPPSPESTSAARLIA